MSTDERADTAQRLVGMPMETVGFIEIHRDQFQLGMVRQGNARWQIRTPVDTPADSGHVERMLSILATLRREEVVTSAQRRLRELDVSHFGLSSPRARLVLGDPYSRMELEIGMDAPLADLVYVRVVGESDVIATGRDILEVLPDSLDAIRDRFVLRGSVPATTRLEVHRPDGGFVQLMQRAGQWNLQQPVVARADRNRVNTILEALYRATAVSFVWDPPLTPSLVSGLPVGLDDRPAVSVEPYALTPQTAQLRITVWAEDDPVGREILLGRPTDETGRWVYACRRDHGTVFTLERALLDVFAVSPDALRDRRIFPLQLEAVMQGVVEIGDRKLSFERSVVQGWMLTEPVRRRADETALQTLLIQLLNMRVQEFPDPNEARQWARLDPPAMRLSLSGDGAGSSFSTRGFHVKLSGRQTGMPWWGYIEPDDCYVQVATTGIDRLTLDGLDPLLYLDRTMLALQPEHIHRITRIRDGVEHSVRRDDTGQWVPVVTGRVVHAQAVGDLLFALAHLKASRIESLNPERLDPYGVEQPYASIAVGLTGDRGIIRRIQVGFLAPSGGRYAMIQGDDTVFVLDRASVDVLTADIEQVSDAGPD